MAHAHGEYYQPQPSYWPIIGSIALFSMAASFTAYLNGVEIGKYLLIAAIGLLFFMMFGWFRAVISESEAGLYNEQVDRSFRWGMIWFIISEIFFFGAFFGALYYTRDLTLPWLLGEGAKGVAHTFLWPEFTDVWPTNGPQSVGGEFETMAAWGIPALNTLILLTSGVTVTWAHWGLKKDNRRQLIIGLFLTVALGFTFVGLQLYEYGHAMDELNLRFSSGIYGSLFYMLTGFHGFHVTVGSIMLLVVLLRSLAGHFTPKHHFAFEGVAWYWHFVDVVWLGLFIFVYWL
ncbi:cytochrome c oxidase subunit 3 [Nitrosococcus watsonii]|uniref:cytochrome-c oxidase n=1 Tax=Nitrosococcus watsoni (strain C-113) TaxID=105559 RepID=D8K4L1_NITWC|nr:cytochrome c oxidase subunit 3 [Nitrosococcus watsonii]ADJ29813.1 Cytochrome-c oxidase [Nitrosococcus watsonii C-113]